MNCPLVPMDEGATIHQRFCGLCGLCGLCGKNPLLNRLNTTYRAKPTTHATREEEGTGREDLLEIHL